MINSKVLDIEDEQMAQMARKTFAGGLYSPSWLTVCEGEWGGRGRGRERQTTREMEREERKGGRKGRSSREKGMQAQPWGWPAGKQEKVPWDGRKDWFLGFPTKTKSQCLTIM